MVRVTEPTTGQTNPAMTDSSPSLFTTARLAKNIRATWWYTASAVVMFAIVAVLVMMGLLLHHNGSEFEILVVGATGLIWSASLVPLLLDYRNRIEAKPGIAWRRFILPACASLLFGAVAYASTSNVMLGVFPLALSIVLLNWMPGIRTRVVIGVTLVLLITAFTLEHGIFGEFDGDDVYVIILLCMLPFMAVSSLWWWDVLIQLDHARTAEVRLAATQERLRVATDVHDLQGHHLQVIALQLELAERLLPGDYEAGIAQLQAARASVDEARQGTREIAMSIRAVPLSDEIQNARDLLVAAGHSVETIIPADSNTAPAQVLGPVIREATTNILRHGGGERARLELTRTAEMWILSIVNDAPRSETETEAFTGAGSGIDGIRQRVAAAGGHSEVVHNEGEFSLTVTVPATLSAHDSSNSFGQGKEFSA